MRADGGGVLEEILRAEQVMTPTGEVLPLHSHAEPDEGRLLQQLIRETGATRTLEIGLAYGVSALYICEALRDVPGAKHVIIDPAQRTATPMANSWSGVGLANLERAGFLDLIEFHEDESCLVLPRLVAEGRRFDLAWIDGSHLFDYALVDFFFVDRLLRPGGVVVFDDVHYPSVRRVCQFLVRNRAYAVLDAAEPEPRQAARMDPADYEPYGLPTAACIAFRKEADDGRDWDHHVAF